MAIKKPKSSTKKPRAGKKGGDPFGLVEAIQDATVREFATEYDKLAERIGLKLAAKSVGKNPNVPDWDADHWKVTLARGKDKLAVFYSKTLGHQGEKPTTEEVLCCVAIDARISDRSDTFEKWTAEYGHEPTTFARKLYEDGKKTSEGLKKLFGDEEYKALLAIDAVKDEETTT